MNLSFKNYRVPNYVVFHVLGFLLKANFAFETFRYFFVVLNQIRLKYRIMTSFEQPPFPDYTTTLLIPAPQASFYALKSGFFHFGCFVELGNCQKLVVSCYF